MSACHENDPARFVIVALPPTHVFEEANQHIHESLYASPVDPERVRAQHAGLCAALEKVGVQVRSVYIPRFDDEYTYVPAKDLANILFMRDAILTTPKGIVIGNFREPIRRHEFDIIHGTLDELGLQPIGNLSMSHARHDAFVEGGDFFSAEDTCIIATGSRTNYAGVRYMMEHNLFGTQRVIVVKFPPDVPDTMNTIHLDCYFGMVGKKHVILWDALKDKLKIDIWEMDLPKCSYILKTKDVDFVEYLQDTMKMEMIYIDTDCQRAYGCNLLDLGNSIVLTQDPVVTRLLQERGYDARFVAFDEIHKMYGGIRCATQVIRGDAVNFL